MIGLMFAAATFLAPAPAPAPAPAEETMLEELWRKNPRTIFTSSKSADALEMCIGKGIAGLRNLIIIPTVFRGENGERLVVIYGGGVLAGTLRITDDARDSRTLELVTRAKEKVNTRFAQIVQRCL